MISLSLRPTIRCDVAIAGGGPAGAAAAAHLARAGLRVVVLDQGAFPRDKVCGDFVGPVALSELVRLGIVRSSAFGRTNVIRRAALFVNGRPLIERHLPVPIGARALARVVPRSILDWWIIRAARARGARVLEQHRVTGYRVENDHVTVLSASPAGEQAIQASLLIGADGSTSLVGRCLRGQTPPKHKRIIAMRAYYANTAGPHDRADLHFTAKSFPGYHWLFPTGGGGANVGVGMLADTTPPTGEHLRDLLIDLVHTDPALRLRLRGARLVGKIVGWPLQTFSPDLPVVGDRVLLVGDAAGFINPLNGEGIPYALLSGRWAAYVAVECQARRDFTRRSLARYATIIDVALRADMAVATFLVQLIRNRRLAHLWLTALQVLAARARRDPAYAMTLGGILAGVIPVRYALSATVLRGTVEETLSLFSTTLDRVLSGEGGTWSAAGAIVAEHTLTLIKEFAGSSDSAHRWKFEVAAAAVELVKQLGVQT